MKYWLLTVLCFFSCSVFAASPKYWVNESSKTVMIAANPTLSVQLHKLAVDDEYYGRLDVDLSYNIREMQAQIDEVMKAFPDYKQQRVVVERNGQYSYEIPLLALKREVDPTPGVEGPYLRDEIYVSRTQYGSLLSALRAGSDLVSIRGSLSGTVPTSRVVERVELEGSVCRRLAPSASTVESMLANTETFFNRELDVRKIVQEATRASLLSDIKQNCFEISEPKTIASFAEVLKLEIRARDPGRKLAGETREKSYGRETFPLAYKLNQTGAKE